MRTIFFSVLFVLFFAGISVAQEEPKNFSLFVQTVPESVGVVSDSFYYGKTPIEFDAPLGMQYWFYLHSLRSWNFYPQHDSISSDKTKWKFHRVNNVVFNVAEHSIQQPSAPTHISLEVNREQFNTTSLYCVGVGTILSGITTVSAKLRSDKLFEQYQNELEASEKKSELRHEVRRLYTISAISLVLSQLGLAYISYTLFTF